MSPQAVAAPHPAVARLLGAATEHRPCAPVRELVRDIDEAYAVQEQFIGSLEDLRTEVVGRKIGLTSREVQRVMGVDTPTSGLLARSMRVANGATVPAAGFLQPRVEAEIAFVLASDVHQPTDRDHLVSCIEAVAPALEIADSRIRDWDISVLDTVADNASGAGFVLGPLRVPRDCPDLREVEMTLRCNDEVVGRGRGDACLGDPLEALAWLARTSHARGRVLRAGEIVLSGALSAPVGVRAGDLVEARLGGLGEVSVRFS